MKYMKRRGLRMFAVAALLPMMALAQNAQNNQAASPEDQATVRQVTQMVQQFLAAVPKGEKRTFENFFADDVIYTRGVGVTVTKADILKNIDVRAVNEPTATFSADDFTVHPYGNMAVVNFRLIMSAEDSGKTQATYFRNTGTFLKRNGKWQVVAWQATKIPPADTKP